MMLGGAYDAAQAWALPVYFSKVTDPVYTFDCVGGRKHVAVHIPKKAAPLSGNDGALVIVDRATDQMVSLFEATSPQESASGTWEASNCSRYYLSSNGINELAVHGTAGNFGHRGVPDWTRVVTVKEVRSGRINRRLACTWEGTRTAHYWPMVRPERRKGIVPEGTVLRIKPSANLDDLVPNAHARVVARALQKYGCVIGDNGGNTLTRLERNERGWRKLGVSKDALRSLPWQYWEFVRGGYDPTDGLTHRPAGGSG